MASPNLARVGINGFGRIGRMVLRASLVKPKESCITPTHPQIVSINDPYMTADQMACLLTHDSTHGIFQGDIELIGSSIKVDGRVIEVTNEKDAAKIPWKNTCVDYVVDATGLNTQYEKASAHLRGSVKRVVITASSKDAPVFVVGVNHECYNNDMKVIALDSDTGNCLAPIARVLHQEFDIESGFITDIHAVTAHQSVVDSAHKIPRVGRGAFQNIIPTFSDAARNIGKIIPELEGKLAGVSVGVPVADGSLLDFTFKIGKSASYDLVKNKLKEAADTYMKGIMGYTEALVVSSDIIGDSRSAVVDGNAGIALSKCNVKIMAWYDNEWGYACRVVDMLKYIFSREACNS